MHPVLARLDNHLGEVRQEHQRQLLGGKMARLPSGRYLVQQSGDTVSLFEDISEREIAYAKANDLNAHGLAMKDIFETELSVEDKTIACFWFGYFYAHAVHDKA
jgi:hypothetical protein